MVGGRKGIRQEMARGNAPGEEQKLKGFGHHVRQAIAGPGNAAVRDLLPDERYTGGGVGDYEDYEN